MFDITILPLTDRAGSEPSELAGLFVACAPRKAARLRAQDQVILYLNPGKSAAAQEQVFSAQQQQEMLSRLADTYFSGKGSTTAAMRAVVTRLNDFMLERNLRAASEGQATGALTLAVMHGTTLLVAHAGPAQSLVLTKAQTQPLDDQDARSLGVSKQLTPRFYQAAIEPGDILLLGGGLAAVEAATSSGGLTTLGMEHLRRRLFAQAGGGHLVAALKFQAGRGQIIRYRVGRETGTAYVPEVVETPQRPVSQPAKQAVPTEPAGLPEEITSTAVTNSASKPVESPFAQPGFVAAEQDGPDFGELTGLTSEPLPVSQLNDHIDVQPSLQPSEPLETQPLPSEATLKEAEPSAMPPRFRRSPPESSGQPTDTQRVSPSKADRAAKTARERRAAGTGRSRQVGLFLKSIFQRGTDARASINKAVEPLTSRVIPPRSELSPAVMLFIVLAIPLVIVAVATTVYFNAGRAEQFESYLSTANQYVARADQQTDPLAQRDNWTQALLWLERAEQYQHNDATAALRQQAQSGLDGMEGVVRLPFQKATAEGFAPDVKITRMAATLNDVYLLDATQGRVLRLYRVGTGYALDSNFLCGPGQAGGQIIGPLIDLAVLPPNNAYQATILAMDANGNAVYCAPNQTAYDSLLIPAPDTNWGNINAIVISDGYLYILDPLVNAVWYIFGNAGVFDQEPRLFFSFQVPQMNDIADFAMDRGFLYLLHQDGRMTTCEASGFELSPTVCNDPVPYGDSRTGRDAAPLNFFDARFSQLQTTQPPDPSLFILDEAQASIYHFSLRRLNLQRQYRAMVDPDFPMPDQAASAFVITPNRRALLAFDNQIYYAPLP